MVDMVYHTDEIVQVLHDQYNGSGNPLLFLLHGLNTDSNNFSKPAEFEVLPYHAFFFSMFLVCKFLRVMAMISSAIFFSSLLRC